MKHFLFVMFIDISAVEYFYNPSLLISPGKKPKHHFSIKVNVTSLFLAKTPENAIPLEC